MDLKSEFELIREGFQGNIDFDLPLSKVAYYQIGGPAAVVVTPKNFEDLKKVHQVLRSTNSPFFVLGWGSNLLFSDDEKKGVFIRMKHLFTEIEEIDEGTLKVGASVGASTLLRTASQKGYGGLAHFTGIPGSVGGMVAMNAGTHLGEMKDCVIKTGFVNLLASALTIEEKVHVASDFSYRHNHFLKGGDLVTHAYLRFEYTSPESVKKQIDELYVRRKATQPVDYPSCGSVFINPKTAGLHAWQVVDRLGLRGHQVGQAQISEKHSNFIINLGGAKASEVRSLIDLIQGRALSELGIALEAEVKILP